MALIKDSTIRNEGWSHAEQALKETLDAIPFTSRQRADIDYRITEMRSLFRESESDVKGYELAEEDRAHSE